MKIFRLKNIYTCRSRVTKTAERDKKIIMRLLKINSSSNKSHWNCRQISTCLKVSEPFIGEICVLALTIPALGVSLQMTCTSPKAPASLLTASCKVDPSCTMLMFSDVAFVKLNIKDGFLIRNISTNFSKSLFIR